MDELETAITEHELLLARLRDLYGFSEVEAMDYAEMFGDVENNKGED